MDCLRDSRMGRLRDPGVFYFCSTVKCLRISYSVSLEAFHFVRISAHSAPSLYRVYRLSDNSTAVEKMITSSPGNPAGPFAPISPRGPCANMIVFTDK